MGLRIARTKVSKTEYVVDLFDGPHAVGRLLAVRAPFQADVVLAETSPAPWVDEEGDDVAVEAIGDCGRDLEHLASRHGVSAEEIVFVGSVDLGHAYRGKGYGVAMYLAAAKHARRMGLAIGSGACLGQPVSDDARAVWRSRRFAARMDIGGASGLVGVYVGEQAARRSQ